MSDEHELGAHLELQEHCGRGRRKSQEMVIVVWPSNEACQKTLQGNDSQAPRGRPKPSSKDRWRSLLSRACEFLAP